MRCPWHCNAGKVGGPLSGRPRPRWRRGPRTRPPRLDASDPAEPPAAPAVTPKPQSPYDFTDPESRIMKTSQDGFQQCHNAQIVVDADSQLIVTAAVSAHASDQGQLPRLLDAVQAHYGHRPTQLLADAGYRNEEDLQELENRGIDGYVALGRERKTASGRGHPACADPTGHPTGSGNICPAHMAGGSAHRLDQAHPGLSLIRHARLAPGPGRVGSGESGSERQAPAPPREARALVPCGPRAARPRLSAGLCPQSLPAHFLWRRLLQKTGVHHEALDIRHTTA